MKKILIICYYWPPSGGSGVQRWLYFVKYLRSFGWEPIVLTVDGGEYPFTDTSLEKHIPKDIQVIKLPIWEPFSIYKRLVRSDQGKSLSPTVLMEDRKGNMLKKFAIWVRGNFFIPDARMFWVQPATKFLTQYLSENKIDVIASTGPPQSMHLIANKITKKFPIPWLADFRDPWTQIYTFNQLKLSPFAKYLHKRLEKQVLLNADKVITVSQHCKLGFNTLVDRQIDVITNGYEPFDFKSNGSLDNIIMLYAGVLSADRNTPLLWKSLNSYLDQHPDIKSKFILRFIGQIDPAVFKSITDSGVNFTVENHNAMPHSQLQEQLAAAHILLLIAVPNDPGVITGKLFEYLFCKKPILSISPTNSDLALILEDSRGGFNADFTDLSAIQDAVVRTFEAVQKNNFLPNSEVIEQFSRKNLTKKLSEILNQMVVNKKD